MKTLGFKELSQSEMVDVQGGVDVKVEFKYTQKDGFSATATLSWSF